MWRGPLQARAARPDSVRRGGARLDAHFEDLPEVLAGHEQPLPLGVPGDAVEHVVGDRFGLHRHQRLAVGAGWVLADAVRVLVVDRRLCDLLDLLRRQRGGHVLSEGAAGICIVIMSSRQAKVTFLRFVSS